MPLIIPTLPVRPPSRLIRRVELQRIDAERPDLECADPRARIYLGLRDTSRALDELEAATKVGEIWHALHGIADRMYRPLRSNPRFHQLLRTIGLGDAIPLLRW